MINREAGKERRSGLLRVRLSKVFNDLWGNRVRTVLIIASIAVGLVALGTINGAQSILATGMERSFAEINPSSGVVRTLQPFDEDFLISVRRMEGVSDADARRTLYAQVEVEPGKWMNLSIFAILDFDAIRVNKVWPQQGEWPPPPRQLLIERAALPLLQTQIGDWLTIETSDGKRRQMRVAGSAHDPAQMPANIDNTPYAYINFETLDWLGEPYGFNELYVVTDRPGEAEYSRGVVNRIKSKAEDSGYIIPMSMTAEPGQVPLDDILQSVLMLMNVLGLLSLFLSCFLIVNSVTALLAQQRRQIGVMKALGASSGQVLGMYLLMVTAYGVAALVIAIPLGDRAAQALSQYLAAMFNFDLALLEMPAAVYWLQVSVGLLTPLLASLVPLLGSARLSAAEAMSVYSLGKGRFGQGLIDRLISGKNLWFARHAPLRSLLLSLRNTFRSQGRLLLTLATLTLASASFVSVFSLQDSMLTTLDDILKWMQFDVMITFDRPHRVEKMELEARQVEGVETVDAWIQLIIRRVRPDGSESKPIYMFAPRADSELSISPEIVSGRWLLPSDENAVVLNAMVLKEEPDLQVGSQMQIKIDGKEHVFQVVGIGMGMPFIPTLHANYPYIARITGRSGRAETALVRVNTANSQSEHSIATALENQYERVGMQVDSIQTISQEREEAKAFFDIVISLLLVMAGLMAIVGGLGLMGTMSINVLERTREVGVLRAIGASNRCVAQVFVLEGLAIGWMSWLLGALLAYPMSHALSQSVGLLMLGVPMSFSYSTTGVWAWLVTVTLLSTLASFAPARSASRLTVREVLAYE